MGADIAARTGGSSACGRAVVAIGLHAQVYEPSTPTITYSIHGAALFCSVRECFLSFFAFFLFLPEMTEMTKCAESWGRLHRAGAWVPAMHVGARGLSQACHAALLHEQRERLWHASGCGSSSTRLGRALAKCIAARLGVVTMQSAHDLYSTNKHRNGLGHPRTRIGGGLWSHTLLLTNQL